MNFEIGVEVPIPSLELVLSQYRLDDCVRPFVLFPKRICPSIKPKELVAATPFTVELRSPVDVASDMVFDEITELVAVTPLIVVVSMLPERV